jgi:hypothetical protein
LNSTTRVCALPAGDVQVSGFTTNISLNQGLNVWVGVGPQTTRLFFTDNLTLPGGVTLQLVNLTMSGPHIGGTAGSSCHVLQVMSVHLQA